MKTAFLISLSVHVGLLVLVWFWGTSFSRPRLQGYPLTINAALIEKSATLRSNQQSFRPPARKIVSKKPPTPQKPVEKKEPAAVQQTVDSKSETTSSNSGENDIPAGTSLSIDVMEFPFPQYLSLVQYRVERQWRPPVAKSEGQSCIVFFRIKLEGKLAEIILEKSSRDFAFDQAAMRAVYNADPLPPLPAESGIPSLGVHFEFVGRK